MPINLNPVLAQIADPTQGRFSQLGANLGNMFLQQQQLEQSKQQAAAEQQTQRQKLRLQMAETFSQLQSDQLERLETETDLVSKSASSLLNTYVDPQSGKITDPVGYQNAYQQIRDRLQQAGIQNIPEQAPSPQRLQQIAQTGLQVKDAIDLARERSEQAILVSPGDPLAERFGVTEETGPQEIKLRGIGRQRPVDFQGTGGGTTVNVGTDKFTEETAKAQVGRLDEIINRGRSAVITQQNLEQMAGLIEQGVQTGKVQQFMPTLQGIAADFGVDLNQIASDMGIENLGALEQKEEFDRLAKQVIIEGFKKFQGNLNRREVQLAEDAFANLGRSEEANRQAVAAGLAAQQIARERAIQASEADSPEEAQEVERQLLSEDVERFKELKQRYLEEIKLPEQKKAPEEVPEGVDPELWDVMTEEEKALWQNKNN